MPTLPRDEALAVLLDREAIEHTQKAEAARKDRRAVWLRLHEGGYTYEDLSRLTGYGSTTVHGELRRARLERAGR